MAQACCEPAYLGLCVNPALRIYGTPDPANEACQAQYEAFRLLPGETRTIVAYAGLGTADQDPTPPYVLAAQGPKTLGVVLGDDPNTSELEESYTTPGTFTIRGFIYNCAEFDITNASLFLTLPPGLRLAAGETAVQQIGTVLRMQEGAASWTVEVEPGVSGTLHYTITSSGVPVNSKTVTSSIEIPAQTRRSFKPGLSMISLPFQFANPDTARALGLPADRIRLARWQPDTQKYAFYPDPAVATVAPGAGYWFKPDLATTMKLQGATPVARSLSANFVLPVKPGWNMIGAPYVYAVPWANTRVSDGQQVLSLDEAARAGWVRPTLFTYNPNLSPPGYEFKAIADASLEPWVGYWLRADRECFLLIPRVTAPYASIAAPDQRSAADGWRIQLAVRTRTASDLFNFAGVSRATPDGYDLSDIDEPPVPGESYVSLRFVHSDWGRNSGFYTQDIRSDEFAGEGVELRGGYRQAGSGCDADLAGGEHPAAAQLLGDPGRSGYRQARFAAHRRHYQFQSTEDPRQFQLVITRRLPTA